MNELLNAGKLDADCLTVTGQSIADNLVGRHATDREVICPFADPLAEQAGFLVLTGNLFDVAIMKTSVISPGFRARYLAREGRENMFEARAIVFD